MVPSRLLLNKLTSMQCLALLLAVAAWLSASPAMAQLGDVGFQVSIASKEMVLENPNDDSVKMFAAWDAPFQRIADRNMPFIEVMNLGGSTGNLTEFNITIGDTDFNFEDDYFGSLIMLGDSTPGFNLSASTVNGDELTVTIGDGGLAPGETVRFRIDLGVDAGVDNMFPHPDFRTVLFDMNDMDNNGMSDNSVVTATFTDPNDASSTTTASSTLLDFGVTGPEAQYFNQFIRPYSQMEGVDIFSLQAVNQTAIPEPATVSLACGLLGAVALLRRRRSRC